MAAASAKTQEVRGLESIFMESPVRKYRTVVVDDSPGYVEVVCSLLAMDEAIDVIGRAGDGGEAVRMAAELSPDLVLMDVHMPGMSGVAATAVLAAFFPNIRVVLMSAEPLPAMMGTGACGFVHKARFVEEFQRVLSTIW